MHRGKAIQLLTESKSTFQLNIDALQSVLGNDRIKDKHVVLISIAGDMRGGKSFILNFFLRYLQSITKESWLYKEDEPLGGFNWKNGDDRDTTGILLWSEPYIVKLRNGEEYAVLLMDTQGTFDKKSSVKKNAMIFALSAMVSSMQIFNVRRQILEDKLQFLRLFTCYGRLAMTHNEGKDKPFQHLHFLVRDWPCPYKNPYGLTGGKSYLEKVLHVDDSTHTEVIEVRQFIEQCFSKIDCCLLPNPGMKVMNCETFDGRITDIEKEFVDILSSYVPTILSPEYMLPKAINGSKVTCYELLEYFKAYFNVFDSDEMPQPIDIFKATTEASNLATLNTCKRMYIDDMTKLCGQDTKFLLENRLKKEHYRIKSTAVAKFNNARKFGDRAQIDVYRQQLEEDIEEYLQGFVDMNGKKNMYERDFWSLVVLLVWYMVGKVVHSVMLMMGMDAALGVVDWVLWAVVLTAIVWLVSFVSGYSAVRMHIDEMMMHSWHYVLRPIITRAKKCALNAVVRNTLTQR